MIIIDYYQSQVSGQHGSGHECLQCEGGHGVGEGDGDRVHAADDVAVGEQRRGGGAVHRSGNIFSFRFDKLLYRYD